MWDLILQMAAAILGLWLSAKFIPGSVNFTGPFFISLKQGLNFSELLRTLVFVGAFLGFLNFFVKPLLNKIALPLRIITFNLFSLLIAMGLVWIVDILSPELIIKGIPALFWTTLIIWLLNFIFSKWWPSKPKYPLPSPN